VKRLGFPLSDIPAFEATIMIQEENINTQKPGY